MVRIAPRLRATACSAGTFLRAPALARTPLAGAVALAALLAGCSGGGGGDAFAGPAVCAPPEIVFFGSSFSDSGNFRALSFGLVPPDPPYADGRWSNGPVWSDRLAARIGIELAPSREGGTNFAIGGARTFTPVLGLLPPLTAQVEEYLAARATSGGVDPAALHLIRAGANDVLAADAGGGVSPAEALDALAGMLADLADAGAELVVVLNLPELPTYGEAGLTWVEEYDASLPDTLAAAPLPVRLFDLRAVIGQMSADPDAFGLVNVTDPCLGSGACSATTLDPVADGYLLYDAAHLTTRMHEVVAGRVHDTLCPGG